MKPGIPASRVDLLLIIDCLWRPRYWKQIPWRFVGLFNPSLARKMRDQIRGKV